MYTIIINKKTCVDLEYYTDAIRLVKSLRDNNSLHLQLLSLCNQYTSVLSHDEIVELLDKESQKLKNDTPAESMPF